MIEHHLDIPTADGPMNSFVVHPDEGGPHPVVLFYMDAPGKREELHDMARRIAAVGYCVVLPNLYYRSERDFWLKERTEAVMAHMFTLMNSLGRETTEIDTRALLAYVDALPAVAAEVILTHCAEVKVTHLGEDDGLFGAVDVDPGGSSGDTSDGPKGRRGEVDCEAAELLAQHGAAIPA